MIANCGVYKITNNVNGKVYIGQSVNIKERVRKHLRGSTNGILSKAISKYGEDSFESSILVFCKPDDLNYYERAFIVMYDSFGVNGYNLTSGGHDQHTRSDETSRKISEMHKLMWSDDAYRDAALSRIQSKESKAKRRISRSIFYSNPDNVTDLSNKHKERIACDSEAYSKLTAQLQTLRDDTEIEKRRIESTRNYWSNEENKVRGVAALVAGKTQESEERRLESIRKFWNSKEAEVHSLNAGLRLREMCSVSVVCVETGVIYPSMLDACRWLLSIGVAKSLNGGSKIGYCCRGLKKSHCGYTWKYA